MAEITSQAYDNLRNYIQTNWNYIELRNDSGTPIIRLNTTDLRVTSTLEGQTVKLQVIVKGSDTDITYPITISSSAIYDVATGGNAYSVESFTPFTIESDQDELTVIHNIEIPKIV
ncbi:hypothetical protein P9274_00985 [Schinkia azotoformans]|uniref:hypothetical protein n=1 Tax=Schinkia azotoformans TaxID=1454 RepID=UPI002E1BAC80|nr:hypothetical protein [Schinkia azotoformans]